VLQHQKYCTITRRVTSRHRANFSTKQCLLCFWWLPSVYQHRTNEILRSGQRN